MIGRFSNLGSYDELLNTRDFFKVGFAGILALAGFLLGKISTEYTTISLALILASVAINGIPIIIDAIKGLIEKRINVDELLSIAIIACLATGEFLTAAVVSFVMVFGGLIEEAASESARNSIRTLIKISPKQATLIVDSKEKVRAIEEVRVGDILLVKPGEQIPVDAVVTRGIASLDESTITGEPVPVEKTIGDTIYAGTFNQNGVIRVKAVKVGKDTTLGKVIRLVSEAEAHKPESIAFVDRFAAWFTPLILFSAAITWGMTHELSRAITVLIVGCPCALILAVPTATVATIGRAAKAGILIKGGQHIERAAFADTILFDKTGTLTEGNPKVDRIVPVKGIEEKYLLRQAACVEKNSTHPLARAVISAARAAGITVNAAQNLLTEIGLGVQGTVDGSVFEVGSVYLYGGITNVPQPLQLPLNTIKDQGATPLMVYQDKQPLGFLSVFDRVRKGAGETIDELKKLGLKNIGILSGDHQKSVNLVRNSVGIEQMWSGLQPDDKLNVIKKLQAQGRRVMFVGDGINDAPAIAVADIGIAMGAKGTEVALETSDIALLNDDLAKLPFLIHLSRRMLLVIKVNIGFALMFNLIAVIAGGSGLLSPVMGAVVHNIGSVLVVFSSASIGFYPDIPRK